MTLQIPPNCDLTLGVVCVDKATPGLSVWTMRCDERFSNPAGVAQGGFLTALADSAMGSSVVTAASPRKVHVANMEVKTSFIRPARTGSLLTCTAQVTRAGRVVTFAQARIVDEKNCLIATAQSTYLVKDRTE